jgi:beta-lactamase superfamily II metal-dependent hydrolase
MFVVTADKGTRLMIDCSHNATTGWKPGTYLKRQGVAQLDMLVITNYDEDHASATADLFDNVFVSWLFRNTSVSAAIIKVLKREQEMWPGIERLVYAIENNFTGNRASAQKPVLQGAKYRFFNNTYPRFDDENNLSMVVFLSCHGIGVMFPGDLEKAGFLELLKMDSFRQALLQTHVYIASHHGRENGCCEEIVQYLKNVYYVVISDKGYQHDTQKTIPFYARIANGGPFGQEQTRKILTTRNDGRIAFEFSPGLWGPRQ